jgi:hypothetical protein
MNHGVCPSLTSALQEEGHCQKKGVEPKLHPHHVEWAAL